MLFKEQPRTQAEAEAQGYMLMDSGCTDRFLGHRYAHQDDDSIILIFDDAGFIAGSQSVIRQEIVDTDIVHIENMPAYQEDAWFGIPVYVTTMYFVDPAIICDGGRTQEEFDTQGTGNQLNIQVGPNSLEVVSLPMSKSAAIDDPTWYDHLCFNGMGDHWLQFDYSPDQDCQSILPLQLLYDDNLGGILNGFVWMHIANPQGPQWEHPDELAVSMIVDKPPTCVMDNINYPGLSTMHHFFMENPLSFKCPQKYEKSVTGYKKLLATYMKK